MTKPFDSWAVFGNNDYPLCPQWAVLFFRRPLAMPKSIRLFLFLLLTAVTIVACGKKETQSATQEAIVTPYHATWISSSAP